MKPFSLKESVRRDFFFLLFFDVYYKIYLSLTRIHLHGFTSFWFLVSFHFFFLVHLYYNWHDLLLYYRTLIYTFVTVPSSLTLINIINVTVPTHEIKDSMDDFLFTFLYTESTNIFSFYLLILYKIIKFHLFFFFPVFVQCDFCYHHSTIYIPIYIVINVCFDSWS